MFLISNLFMWGHLNKHEASSSLPFEVTMNTGSCFITSQTISSPSSVHRNEAQPLRVSHWSPFEPYLERLAAKIFCVKSRCSATELQPLPVEYQIASLVTMPNSISATVNPYSPALCFRILDGRKSQGNQPHSVQRIILHRTVKHIAQTKE